MNIVAYFQKLMKVADQEMKLKEWYEFAATEHSDRSEQPEHPTPTRAATEDSTPTSADEVYTIDQ